MDNYKLENPVIVTDLRIPFAEDRTRLDLTCVVFVIVLNHHQLGGYSKLVETFTRIERCKRKVRGRTRTRAYELIQALQGLGVHRIEQ